MSARLTETRVSMKSIAAMRRFRTVGMAVRPIYEGPSQPKLGLVDAIKWYRVLTCKTSPIS
jgi:hypothetical protein